ncbi:hypothetical protein CA85_15160 [Allorhodopirellula solitaria]|uniref:Uncharacterized protein n=1 Tax=Allorhodopirellula solitaria TaxID=2527987 RepID=A0A5C5YCE0_9BACT|nr:hypothetical protein CA85_15160 [Allorhodopirellula solitaria]
MLRHAATVGRSTAGRDGATCGESISPIGCARPCMGGRSLRLAAGESIGRLLTNASTAAPGVAVRKQSMLSGDLATDDPYLS